MDTQDWIKVGILARERWAGVNGQTIIGQCTHIRVVVPIPIPGIPFPDVVGRRGRNEPPPFKQEEIVLETLRLGNGKWVHIGYGEQTNSLWIRDSDLTD